MSRHAHDTAGISVVLAGSLVEDAENRSACAAAGSVVVKPRHIFHENRFGPLGATLFAITIEDGAEVSEPPAWSWQRSFEVYRLAVGALQALATRDLASCEEYVNDIHAVLSITACAERRPSSAWLDDLRCRFDECDREMRIGEIALDYGVHPVYLARVFRAAFGCSVSTYRRQARLLRAARLMCSDTLSVSEIAHRAGFADHSHLTREFNRELHLRPSAFRDILSAHREVRGNEV
jgi:AraC family transcriptional regulator